MDKSSYDRRYVCDGVTDRMAILHDRYYMYCCGHNENGDDLTINGATVARSKCKTDIEILELINELLGHIDHDFYLSETAAKGFEKLCEPLERHRRYRQEK